MTIIYKTLAVIYRQYLDRKIDIPYFRTAMTVIGLLFLHVVQLVLLFNLPSAFIMPGIVETDSGTVKFLKGAVYFVTLILIFYTLINKKKVLAVEVTHEEIKKGNFF